MICDTTKMFFFNNLELIQNIAVLKEEKVKAYNKNTVTILCWSIKRFTTVRSCLNVVLKCLSAHSTAFKDIFSGDGINIGMAQRVRLLNCNAMINFYGIKVFLLGY